MDSHSGGGSSTDSGDTFTMDITKATINDTKVSSKVKLENSDHLTPSLDDNSNQKPKINEFKEEFNKFFNSTFPLEKTPLELLKQISFTGSIRFSPIRGFLWRIFLGTLDINRVGNWEKDISIQRNQYNELVELHMFDPRKTGDVYDPLSQNDNSPWKLFFQGQQTQKLIEIDLQRTYPDNDFFQSEDIKSKMLRILFVYSKTNGVISYRQGMHELLAPIVYLYEREFKHYIKEFKGCGDHHIIDYIYDEKFIEHDIYSVFSTLMKYTCNWYAPAPKNNSSNNNNSNSNSVGIISPLTNGNNNNINNNSNVIIGSPTIAIPTITSPLGGGGLASSPSLNNLTVLQISTPFESKERPDESKFNEAVQKCKYIHSYLLKQKDNELYKHLESLQIEPQIYLLRWIRLLFGREYHLEDLLNIWDCIFAFGDDLKLIDYLCISMLAYIRDQLLQSDNISALQRIYKYPPVEDIYLLVKQAMVIKDSNSEISSIPSLVKAPNNDKLQHNNSTTVTTISPSNSNQTKETTTKIETKVKVVSNNIFSDISFSDLGSFIPFSSQITSTATKNIMSPINRIKDDVLGLKSKRASLPIHTTYNAKTQSFEHTIPSPLTPAFSTTPLSTSSPILLSNNTTTNTTNNIVSSTNNINKEPVKPITTTTKITINPLESTGIDDDIEVKSKPDLITTSMDVKTARSNYFNDPKNATIQSTVKHSYVTPRVGQPNKQQLEIKRLKSIQKYLGNSLGEIIPILQKAIKTSSTLPNLIIQKKEEEVDEKQKEIDNNDDIQDLQKENNNSDDIINSSGSGESTITTSITPTSSSANNNEEGSLSPLLSPISLSLEGSEHLLIAIAKIKDIKNMLLGELPIPDIVNDFSFDTEEEDSSDQSIVDTHVSNN